MAQGVHSRYKMDDGLIHITVEIYDDLSPQHITEDSVLESSLDCLVYYHSQKTTNLGTLHRSRLWQILLCLCAGILHQPLP